MSSTARKNETFQDLDQTRTNLPQESLSKLNALDRVQAVIEFDLNGNILHANDNFLKTVGYNLDEIQGQHHSIFCDPEYTNSLAYKNLWRKLNKGEVESGEFKRFGKDKKEVWINASYNPILNESGVPFKVVKFATDVTSDKMKNAEFESKLKAIDKVQAVIEFNLDGTIINANDNFIKTVGYDLNEIKGRHHSMFCEPGHVNSQHYKDFWSKLNRGEFDSGEYKRLGKGGKEIWINASYNPIFNSEGKVVKVVKYATDITMSKNKNAEFEGKINAILKAQAVIEFNLDGTVITANENFTNTVGYHLSEIVGKHHSMFCESSYTNSADYKNFWQKLNRGEFDAGEYKRIGKGGKEVWISASYNPIFNADGKVYKVVKFASDVSARIQMEKEIKLKATSDKERVDYLLGLVEKAAGGDLTAEIKEMGQDPIGMLSHGIDSMMKDLRKLISHLIESVNTFNTMATDISKNSQEVATGARNQGASIEEMNATVEELSASIDMIANSAKKTKETADKASVEAGLGSKAVQRSIVAMDEISKSSEDIGEIIEVIKGIADQTNLLAFNAAIEAARAGEHGLGFSVVADEVRKLAEKSSDAAKKISQLIKSSIKKINDGSEVSKEAAKAFEKIVEGVELTSKSIAQISHSTEEQSGATKGVAMSIEKVSGEVEKSVEASSMIAKSANDLLGNASKLSNMVSRFKV